MKKKSLLLTAVATLTLTAATMAQNVPSYVPTNGLVGWWPFNGNINDLSGSGNDCNNPIGNYSFDRYGISSASFYGNGLGSGMYITSLNNFPFANSNRSISVWFKCDMPYPGGLRELFSYGDNTPGTRFGIFLDGSSIGVEYMSGSVVTFFTPDDNWHNITVTYDGNGSSGINLYLDGLTTSSNVNNPIVSLNTLNSFVKTIGRLNDIYNFAGNYDDIGIWNRALTQQEISSLNNGCQLTINSQPSSQIINISNNALFFVGSSDPNATYQWQTDLGVGFQNLNSVGQYSGTTNDTLTLSNVTLGNNNQPFRCIINSGSCSDTSNVAVLNVNNNVGINETTQDNLISVFPNPAQSIINAKVDSKLIGEAFTIYDNKGKVVLIGVINSENTMIELVNLSGGIYMFSVGENMKQSFRIIKE
jgi:hypothetical protein